MEFEWDEAKAAANIINHGVTFAEASTVFDDGGGSDAYDELHSDNEERFIRTGYTQTRRLIAVSYTERGDKIRIISARPLTPRERRKYEEDDL
ncbi:MAG: BrnT family toxin [Armatimonadetes bacterium]|nr:BrnT family toxin [Armatimonadota bacterium]